MEKPSPLSPEFLHRHAGGLRALVKTLVLDDERVEEIVQRTWLAALERPPAHRESAQAWLMTVARRLVARGHRDELRRRRREERAARPEQLPPTDEIVAREMARRKVVDAVLDLDEPYRSTILYRFFENLSPAEVALRLGRPVETVRTQVKRGLERLRHKLDRSFGGDHRDWHLALLPLVKLPLGGLLAGSGAAAGGGALGGAVFAPGVLAGLVAALAFAALLGGALLFWPLAFPGQGAAGHRSEVMPSPPQQAEEQLAADQVGARVVRRPLAAAPASSERIEVRVVARRDGRGLAGLRVLLGSRHPLLESLLAAGSAAGAPAQCSPKLLQGLFAARPGAALAPVLLRSDEQGRVLAAKAYEGCYATVKDPFFYAVEYPRCYAGCADQLLHVELGGRVTGRVLFGTACGAGARATLIAEESSRGASARRGFGARPYRRSATIDADGAFAFDAVPAGGARYHIEILIPAASTAVSAPFGVRPAEVHHLEIPLRPGVELSGTVNAAEGEPIPAAEVLLFFADGFRGGRFERGPMSAPAVRALSDAHGVFTLPGVGAGRYRLEARAAGFESAGKRSLQVADEPVGGLDLRLARATRAPAAEAPPGGSLLIAPSYPEGAEPPVEVVVTLRGASRGRAFRSEIFARPGRAEMRVAALAAGHYRLRVDARGFAPAQAEVDLPSGSTGTRVEVALERGVLLRGRTLLDGGEDPVVGAELFAVRAGAPPRGGELEMAAGVDRVWSDEHGCFTIAGIAPGRYRLLASHPDYPEVSSEEMELRASGSPLDCELRFVQPGVIRGVVLDEMGLPCESVLIAARLASREDGRSGGRRHAARSDAEGAYEIPLLAAGRYEVQLFERGENERRSRSLAKRSVDVAAGLEARADFRIPATTGGATLVLEVRDAGAPVSAGSVRILSGGRTWRARPIDANGRCRLAGLSAGHYLLAVSARASSPRREWGAALLEIDVSGEGEIQRVFDLPRGSIAGVVVGADGRAVSAPVRLVLESPGGGSQTVGWRRSDAEGRFSFEHVRVGAYRLLVGAASGNPERRRGWPRAHRRAGGARAGSRFGGSLVTFSLGCTLAAGERRADLRLVLPKPKPAPAADQALQGRESAAATGERDREQRR